MFILSHFPKKVNMKEGGERLHFLFFDAFEKGLPTPTDRRLAPRQNLDPPNHSRFPSKKRRRFHAFFMLFFWG